VLQSPGNALGGEKFGIQPAVQVVDGNGLLLNSYVGTAYAVMESSPTGYEPLYFMPDNGVGCDPSGNCGMKVVGALASVPISQGVAIFSVNFPFFI